MPNPPEWLLAQYTDTARAAAIYGDLEEIGATRGRAWFWREYLRVMIRLLITARVWAIGISASIWAYVLMDKFHVGNAVCRWTRWQFRGLARPIPWLQIAYRLPLAQYWGRLTIMSLFGVWFLLAFVLIRYGLRDRLTQFTCAMFVMFIPFSSAWPGAMQIAHTAMTVTFIAALCLRNWRRPAIVYALAVWINLKALRLVNRLLHHFAPQFWIRHPALIPSPHYAGYASYGCDVPLTSPRLY